MVWPDHKLRDYIPFNRTGKVIFTTRFEPVALNLMNKDHVVKLPNEDKVMAKELLKIRFTIKGRSFRE